MRQSIVPFLAFALGALVTPARAQDARFEFPGVSAPVRDAAKLFSAEAVRKASAEIDRAERETKAAVLVETIETSGDQPVKAVAVANARHWGRHGVYVLISKKEQHFEVVPTPGFEKVVDVEDVQTIRDAFLNQFKAGRFDDGLKDGVHSIGLLLAVAAKDGKLIGLASASKIEKPRTGGPRPSQLVVRNQAHLTLEGARAIIAGAEAKAAELKLKQNIAVVDDGGHLLAFARMDGARPASAYTAITKATSAATFRTATGPLVKKVERPEGGGTPDAKEITPPPDPLLNLSLQNAASASGGKITTLLGGIPITVDGEQVIGAVGVGGGTGEQDVEVAKAGIDAFKMSLSGEHTDKN